MTRTKFSPSRESGPNQLWETVEEAEAAGTLRAQYAEEWAKYLEANGCTYLDGC